MGMNSIQCNNSKFDFYIIQQYMEFLNFKGGSNSTCVSYVKNIPLLHKNT